MPICPACHSARAASFVAHPKDFEGYAQTNRTFNVLRCLDCKSIFLDPPPTLDDTKAFYAPDYMSKADKGGLFNLLTGAWDRRAASAFARRFGASARVLDYGCGQGEFGRRLRSIGMRDVSGYDPMPKADCGFYRSLAEIDGREFDVIRMNDTIEHLTDFDRTMMRLRGMLAPRGVVFGVTANGAHRSAAMFGRYWGFLHYPYHTLIFSPEGLKIAAHRWGFARASIARSLNPSAWSFTAEHFLKELVGSKRRGHLGSYPFLVLASAPLAALDYVTPGMTAEFQFALTVN